MRIERIPGHGPRAEFRLFDGRHEIGYIRDGAVGFMGFPTRDGAARAALAAHRGLERRRAGATWINSPADGYYVWDREDGPYVVLRSGLLARLTAPVPGGEPDGWGFEVRLLPDERSSSVFAMSRARTVWQSLRGSGLHPRPSPTPTRENDHVGTAHLPQGPTPSSRPVGARSAAAGARA